MKIKYIILLLSCLTVNGACVKETVGTDPSRDDIRLYAAMPVQLRPISMPASKGSDSSDSGILNPTSGTVLNIALARVDQTFLDYPSFIDCQLLPATMEKPDESNSYMREIKFRNAQFYNANNKISFAAWYPWPESLPEGYDYETTEESTVVTIPIDGQTDIMYSTVSEGDRNHGFGVLNFNHALCIYRIYVYAMVYTDDDGDEVNTSDTWGRLLTMSVPRMATSCKMTLPCAGTSQQYDISYDFGTGEGQNIDISNSDNNIFFDPGSGNIPVGLSQKHHAATFVAAPPQDGILSINLTTSGGGDAVQKVSVARNFQEGYAYDIILRFSDHGVINADVSVSDWLVGDSVEQVADQSIFYDLSTYGTSNCYHISSANYSYCFDGRVKGNGNYSTLGLTEDSVILDPEPAYVDIVWYDMEKCPVSLSSNTLVNGRVLLKVTGNEGSTLIPEESEGNVLIAAYDKIPEKDVSGQIINGAKIIWTWHLWLSDPVIDQGYSNGFIVQDRNLGAVDNVPDGSGECRNIWGLLYQWGRHTPFRNNEAPDRWDNESVDMQTAVSNPTVIYGAGADGNDQMWLEDSKLAEYMENLWGYTADYEDPVKTIYDPCPQGYRVFEERMWRGLGSYQKELTDEYVHLGIYLNDVYYPFQDTYLADKSHVEHGSGADSYNKGAFLWSGTIDMDLSTPTPYRLIYNSQSGRGASYSVSNDNRRNSIMPVRCVAEHSKGVITDLSASQTANCYMVHKEGFYKFKTNIRGNGVGRLLPLGGSNLAEINAGLTTAIRPAKVDFLWWQGDFSEMTGTESDIESLIDKVSILNNGVPDENGYVTFCVDEFHKGNYILAAYDTDGIILWTWHIWLTDSPDLKKSGTYVVMDRFLGATMAPDLTSAGSPFATVKNGSLVTYGFYYQWGRKDPIPGPPLWNSGNLNNNSSSVWWMKSYDNGKWTSHTDVEVLPATAISESVRNPTAFYASETKSTADDDESIPLSNWFDSDFDDGYTNVALWGYAVANYKLGESFTKTMYDPCPPGYMIPEYKMWNNDDSSKYSNKDGGDISLGSGETAYSSIYYGTGIVTVKNGFDRNWYPMAGYRDPVTGYVMDAGTKGYMWTSTPMGMHNTRSFYYDSYNSGQTAEYTTSGKGSAYGYQVRCMKE